MVRFLVRLMAHALVSARPPRHAKAGFNRPRQLIQRAEDYVTNLTNQPLRISQLCRELNVSERTLREAFYKAIDTSPLSYLKTQRLNRAYRVLRDSVPGKVLIKQVAITNGFKHLGHFSRDDQQLFGELPNETLRRRK